MTSYTASASQPAEQVVTPPQRIFVGLKLAPAVALALAEFAHPLEAHGARLIAAADVHLTLVPPWSEMQTAEVIATLRAVAAKLRGFVLEFRSVRFGPTLRHPRLLWVDCEQSAELSALRTALIAACGKNDPRPFAPHITLARLPKNGGAIARRCPMHHTILMTQRVTSVELFQSPASGQRGYRVLASLPLATDSGSDAVAG